MPTELEELVEFLHHGNTQVRQVAAEHLVGYSLSDPALFTRNQLEPIKDLKLLVRDYAPISRNALTILINLSGTETSESKKTKDEVLKNLAGDELFVEMLLSKLAGEWREGSVDECAMLLANLVKDEKLVEKLIKLEREVPKKIQLKIKQKDGAKEEVRELQVSNSKRVLDQLMDLFVTGAEGSLCPGANYDYLAYVFADISRLKEGREYLLTRQDYDDVVPIRKLVVFTDENKTSTVRRKGVASVIKNVCFEVDRHDILLQEQDDGAANLLPYVLLPLMGNEEFDDKESETMLADLQLLPPDKQRDADRDILVTHLETLLLLTTKKDGRDYLRRVGTYPVVRECHAAVENEKVREACERLVNVLMRDEEKEDGEQTDTSRIQEITDDDHDNENHDLSSSNKVIDEKPASNTNAAVAAEEDDETTMEEIF